MPSKFQNDAIFWVEVEKIKPNPYQPRRDFNEERLRDLAESIRQYGILQPLTVTRKEEVKEDGGLRVEYELIAGERRHRASQLANLSQVPVIIRSGEEDAQAKLELAIIENLQREDLNPIERAEAFDQLANEFDFTHKQVAEKIGKSREYVSNSMRLLKLPEEIKQAIIAGQMTEGHARPIMMLRDTPEQQEMLFKEVVHKGLTVREAESIARRDAQDKVRKKKNKIDPQTKGLEDRLSDTFGTRVKIEERDVGGKLVIDFFSNEDLENIIKLVRAEGNVEMGDMMEQYVDSITDDDETETPEDADQANTSNNEVNLATDAATKDEEDPQESAGKSMAETLGTMIAAARARQTSPQNSDTNIASDESGNESKAEEVARESQPVDTVQPSSSSPTVPEATPESTSTEASADTSDETRNTEVSQSATNTEEADPDEATTDADFIRSVPEDNPVTGKEEETTEAESSEDDEVLFEEQGDESGEEEQEDEADEVDKEDEIYSVSNFSI